MDPIPSDADDTSKLHKKPKFTTQHKTKFDDARSLSLSLKSLFLSGTQAFLFWVSLKEGGEQVFGFLGVSSLSSCNKQSQQGHYLLTYLLTTHTTRISLFFLSLLGLAYQGKDIVFRSIIEYSSLKDFLKAPR
jgi:hypothetical protein